MAVSRYQRWYGRDEPPAVMVPLRAGRLTLTLDGVDLRWVRLGDVEVVRRLYVAVRDRDWNTIPALLANVSLAAAEDSFELTFDAEHEAGELRFAWKGRLAGSAEGVLTASVDGVCGGSFLYNRIGICVLHPMNDAGRRFRARTPDGEIGGELPLTIGPQRIVEGTIYPLFPSYDRLEIDSSPSLRTTFSFEGDLFEMEDQRNWTDASFKTYSTPLSLPFPHSAAPGRRIGQRVEIRVDGAPPPAARKDGGIEISLGDRLGRTLPSLGFGTASNGRDLTERETELLLAVAPDHVRVDLDLGDPAWPGELARAGRTAGALRCALELALFFGEDVERQLRDLVAALDDRRPKLARVLVFRAGAAVAPAPLLVRVRERLRAVSPLVAGGTNAYFTDLNRNRPDTSTVDAVVYSINPQVHAVDDASLVETLEAQAHTVRSARAFSGDLPILVGPVTLRPRFNPNATGPEPEPAAGELPPEVDPRQMSLLGAGWTLGSVKHLAEAGAASLTYYETTGWRGLIEIESGAPLPELFPSVPGEPYPLYWVFRDLARLKSAELVASRSSEPLAVEALALRGAGATTVLLANLTPVQQHGRVAGASEFRLGPFERGSLEILS